MQLQVTELSTTDKNFAAQLQLLLVRGSEFDADIDATVRSIIDRVRNEGDAALIELVGKFDGLNLLDPSEIEVSQDEWHQAIQRAKPKVMNAMQQAAARIRSFHERQIEQSWQFEDEYGSVLGQRVTPVKRVGVYAPGGKAAYPSSVLMGAIPARVAGVEEVVLASPAPGGEIVDAVLQAAFCAGVDRVFKVGGAQAIAALAHGTDTIPKVDKIVGPGNAWVSAAKRQVFGHVGIDLIAGPSEVVVVCDSSADPEWVAMDLFAQAEHDVDAQSILISDSRELISSVHDAMRRILPELERREIIIQSIESQGAFIHVSDSS